MAPALTCAQVGRAVVASAITGPRARVTATRPDPRRSPSTMTVTIPRASAAYSGLHLAACDPASTAALRAVTLAERRLSRALGRPVRIAEVTQRRSRVALTILT